jgi:putative transposase
VVLQWSSFDEIQIRRSQLFPGCSGAGNCTFGARLGRDAAEGSAEGWAEFFKSLKERGLRGVKPVISDAHTGLKAAVRKVLKVEWQRCKVHFYRNVLVHVPERSQAEVSEAMKAVFV